MNAKKTQVLIQDGGVEHCFEINKLYATEKVDFTNYVLGLMAKSGDNSGKILENVMVLKNNADVEDTGLDALGLLTNAITSLLSNSSRDQKNEVMNMMISKCIHINGSVRLPVQDMNYLNSVFDDGFSIYKLFFECVKFNFNFLPQESQSNT